IFNYTALKGGKIEIPCNASVSANDSVTLILWYKSENATGPPIYSVDLRNRTFSTAVHTISERYKKRLLFDMSNEPSLLRIDPVFEEDIGEYLCRVDFRHERTRGYVTFLNVVVFPKKIFIVDTDSQLLSGVIGPYDENSSIDLICKAEGKPPPKLHWYRNNVLVDESYSVVGDTKEVENHIRIVNLTRADLNVVYKCSAFNELFSLTISSSVQIDVNLRPIDVQISSKKRALSAGKLTEIVCQSRGSRPSPNLTWLRNHKPMADVRQTVSFDENTTRSVLTFIPSEYDNQQMLTCRSENSRLPGYALEDNWRLTVFYIIITGEYLVVDSLRREHSGIYWCVATNVEGNGRSNELQLTIQYVPICKAAQKIFYGVSSGETVFISCEVEANPEYVNFTWTINNKQKTRKTLSSQLFTNFHLRSVLKFTPNKAEDYGTISCSAVNALGPQREPCHFTILPTGPPDSLEQCTISNKSFEAIRIECTPGYNGGLPQTFHLQLYESNVKKAIVSYSQEREAAFVLSNLEPNRTYFIHIFSSNAKGRSDALVLPLSTLSFRGFMVQNRRTKLEVNTELNTIVIHPEVRPLLNALSNDGQSPDLKSKDVEQSSNNENNESVVE
ncbi:nephrin-like protein, partial [Dinothrombium tinctorium]